MTIPVSPVPADRVLGEARGAESSAMRERVCAARERQARRLGPGRLNSMMTRDELRRAGQVSPDAHRLLAHHADSTSTRALVTVQEVARTLADLNDTDAVGESEMRLAWRLRAPELVGWAESA